MERTAAKIEDGVVTQVIVGSYEWANHRLGGEWVNTTGKSVGIGYSYLDGEFRPPRPYPSWTWDGEKWDAPVAYPEDEEELYLWDEETLSWKVIEQDI